MLATLGQQIANGVSLGAAYALMALGYSIVYGILRRINFAQGGFYVVGAFSAYLLTPVVARVVPNGWLDAFCLLVLSMAITAATGALVELVAYRPFRSSPLFTTVVTSMAMLILLSNVVMIVVGAQPVTLAPFFGTATWSLGPVILSPSEVVLVGVSLLLVLILEAFVKYTRLGRAIRAIAENMEAAALMGIPVQRVITLAFVIGGALGAAGGVLVGINYGTIVFSMGTMAGLEGFTAATLGGIGNLTGAALGGLLLGLIQSLAAMVLSTEWTNVLIFSILILLLALRPTGILGEVEAQRV